LPRPTRTSGRRYQREPDEGYRWQLFGLCLAFIPVAFGILACCLGIVVAEAVIFTATWRTASFRLANGAAKRRV
jgi:hypothetical protein